MRRYQTADKAEALLAEGLPKAIRPPLHRLARDLVSVLRWRLVRALLGDLAPSVEATLAAAGATYRAIGSHNPDLPDPVDQGTYWFNWGWTVAEQIVAHKVGAIAIDGDVPASATEDGRQ